MLSVSFIRLRQLRYRCLAIARMGSLVFALFLNLIFLSGCSLDASIQNITDAIATFKTTDKSTMAMAPSQQEYAKDETGQYRVRSAVGEVTTGEATVTRGTKVYRTEISITYQKM